jgi:exodeoxyribonuclease VII large subunit
VQHVIGLRTHEVQKNLRDIEQTARAQLAKSQQNCNRHHQDTAHQAQAQLALIKQKTEANLEQVRAGSRQALQHSRIHVLNAWNTVKDRCAAHVKETRREVDIHRRDVASNAQRQITQLRETSQAWMREIAGQSPQRTLERGFALVHDSQGSPITRASAIEPQRLSSESIGDIRIQFADGAHSARLLPSHQPETI